MSTIAVSLASVFTFLAALHLYWGCGGKAGATVAIPKNPDGQPVFRPGMIACLVVAGGLLAIAGACLVGGGFVGTAWRSRTIPIVLYTCAAGFLLRAIGDRRYVGFFRKIKTSDFAQMDRKYFTPLCVVLSIGLCALAHGGW